MRGRDRKAKSDPRPGLLFVVSRHAPKQYEYLKRVFAKHAYRLAVSSTKSMTGHMMGAAGAFEAVATILTLYNQVLNRAFPLNLE